MDRYWFLTWTTFGSWLPGDRRGSTSSVRIDGVRGRRNVPALPPAPHQPGLERLTRNSMTAPPVRLGRRQAGTVLRQCHATAARRGWRLLACAVMSNHVHVVVGVPGDPDPTGILRDLKSDASHALNLRWGAIDRRPRWWTRSGSCRRLRTQENVVAAMAYVRAQYRPLAWWCDDTSGW